MNLNPSQKVQTALAFVVLCLVIAVFATGIYVVKQFTQNELITVTPQATQVGQVQPTRAKANPKPTRTPTARPSRTPKPQLAPTDPLEVPYDPYGQPSLEDWKELPVLPQVSQHALEIYQKGIARGTDPKSFSKIGDCQSIRQYFIGIFDDPGAYRIGDYEYLKPAIEEFHGSFDRKSKAVRTGFNVASVLSPLNADPAECKPDETPLACEFRLQNPSIVFISMETWTEDRPTYLYEEYLRQIVDYSISQGVLPILATKADNLEGDHSINARIARVAQEYDLPLWNFWAAVQTLPDQGLMDDGFHLTNDHNRYDLKETFESAWPVRNLSALMALDAVWRAVTDQPESPDFALP